MKYFLRIILLFSISIGVSNAQQGEKTTETSVCENDVKTVSNQITDICASGITYENVDLLIGLLETALNSVGSMKELFIVEEAITDIYASGLELSEAQSAKLGELNKLSNNKHATQRSGGDASLKFETALNRLELYLNKKSYAVEPTVNSLIDVLSEKDGVLTKNDFVAMESILVILRSQYCPEITAQKYAGFINIMDLLLVEQRAEPSKQVILTKEVRKEMTKIKYEACNPRR